MYKAERIVPHCYPRFATRATAQILRFGFAVQAQAWHTAPAAGSIITVTNAYDTAVDNNPIVALIEQWCKYGANSRVYQFEADLKLGHDLIDPAQPGCQNRCCVSAVDRFNYTVSR